MVFHASEPYVSAGNIRSAFMVLKLSVQILTYELCVSE